MNSYHCMLILASLVAASCVTSETLPERAPAEANAVVDFWRTAGPDLWFAKDPDFDRRFRERFLTLHEAAAHHELDAWQRTPIGALGLLLLLDQFPRNAFRGTPRMYSTDAQARAVASAAIANGNDRALDVPMRLFVYLPFGHSEDLADQERSVELARGLAPVDLVHAEHHRDIVRRFGRFPHRNAILQRASRPDEVRYLAEGGFAG